MSDKKEKIIFTLDQINNLLNLLEAKKYKQVRHKLLSTIGITNGKRNKKISKSSELEIKQRALEFRDRLIENQTESEKVFKALLKSANIEYDFQSIFWFRKGKGLSFYILDFYIPSLNLAIEIDGGYHNTEEQKKLDKNRTNVITKYSELKLIRFSNKEVLEDNQGVIDKVKAIPLFVALTPNQKKTKNRSKLYTVDTKVIDGNVYKTRVKK
jgi:very-short-patch-repair endonuclease